MLWLASCKELGLNGLLQLLPLLLLLILLGRKSGWPGISFTLGAAAVTQEMLFKGNLLDPFHGTMARRSRNFSIEDKAWSWLMDAGEWIRQMGSQFTEIPFGQATLSGAEMASMGRWCSIIWMPERRFREESRF